MFTMQLTRFGAALAVMAGVLRIVAAFVLDAPEIEAFYLVIDLCILFGLIGVFLPQLESLGWCGLIGFVVALTGAALIVGPDASILEVGTDFAGTLALLIGLNLLGVATWQSESLPRWIPTLWALSTVAGLVSVATSNLEWLFTASGVLFGLGFLGAGFSALSRSKRSIRHPPLERVEVSM
jgi:hypothetical protein